MTTSRQETIERIIYVMREHSSQFTARAFRAELCEWGMYINLKEAQRILDEYVKNDKLNKKKINNLILYY